MFHNWSTTPFFNGYPYIPPPPPPPLYPICWSVTVEVVPEERGADEDTEEAPGVYVTLPEGDNEVRFDGDFAEVFEGALIVRDDGDVTGAVAAGQWVRYRVVRNNEESE